MNPSSSPVVNQHIAGLPNNAEAAAVTHTMSPQRGQVNVHSGPEVQQFGHAIVGDGQPISDVIDGKIVVQGASTPAAASTCSTAAVTGGDHQHHHHVHHTAAGAAVSDPPKDYLHDGSTYASGASNQSYSDVGSDERPGLMTRVKETIPGTHEHQQKKEHDGNLAVYM